MSPPTLLSRSALAALALALQACIYVPRTTQVFDPACGLMSRHMVLEGAQVGAISRCENQGCVTLIVAASAVTAATLIVSGSIVIVGNIAYWLETRARCRPDPLLDLQPDPVT